MFDVPDPFHAAVVHFPIVFVFVATVLALLSIFTKRAFLPQFTALFFVLAGGSAQYAVMTGEDQARAILPEKPAAKTLIEHHAEWGERARTFAGGAAVCAVLALVIVRARRFRAGLAFITTLVGLGACYCVVEAGERGGEMVYQHGVGVQRGENAPDTAGTPVPTSSPEASPTTQSTPP